MIQRVQLEEPENSENLKILENEGSFQNENEISNSETNEDNIMVKNQTQPLAWKAQSHQRNQIFEENMS